MVKVFFMAISRIREAEGMTWVFLENQREKLH